MANTQNCRSNQVDFISSLPDEILLIILSKLSTVEQVRTSILSHRWTTLCTFTHCLAIDAADFLPTEEINQFTNAVDQVLRTHRARTIDQFKLRYPPDPVKSPVDDSWINIAREKQVKALHLDLNLHDVKMSSLPSLTFSSLVTLSLKRARKLPDKIIHGLLSNLSNLLELSIIECHGLDRLRIASSLKLKHLELICNFSIDFLEISAPNLELFNFSTHRYSPDWPGICFNNITLLTQLCCPLGMMLGAWYVFRDLLPQLVTLTLTLWEKPTVDIPSFPELTNLEQMNVRMHLMDLRLLPMKVRLLPGEDDSSLLHLLLGLFRASPRLGRLSLDLLARAFPAHKFLELIDDFKVSEHEVKVLIRIAESCPSLQKIIIHPEPEPARKVSLRSWLQGCLERS